MGFNMWCVSQPGSYPPFSDIFGISRAESNALDGMRLVDPPAWWWRIIQSLGTVKLNYWLWLLLFAEYLLKAESRLSPGYVWMEIRLSENQSGDRSDLTSNVTQRAGCS